MNKKDIKLQVNTYVIHRKTKNIKCFHFSKIKSIRSKYKINLLDELHPRFYDRIISSV